MNSHETSKPNLVETFSLFPIQNEALWNAYKQHVSVFWTVEEVDLSRDLESWARLRPEEKQLVEYVLAFFSVADGIVADNIVQRLMFEVDSREAQCFYGFQLMIENIHAEMYSILMDTYISDLDQRAQLFNAVDTLPAVREKAEWALRWMRADAPLDELILAFACVEGIFFSGCFAIIYWLKRRGELPGLTFSNELISRDEGLHRDFALLLLKQRGYRIQNIQEIVKDAVRVEHLFVDAALPQPIEGLSAQDLKTYIECVANNLLATLGEPPCFESTNPFEWMDLISIDGKKNFFESRVSDYARRITADTEQLVFDATF